MLVKRKEIWLANLGIKESSSIQGNIRPVLVVSNEMCNKYSTVLTVLPITSKQKNKLPTHIEVGVKYGLKQTSTIMAEQIMPIDKERFIKKIGECDDEIMKKVEIAINIQNGIVNVDYINQLIKEIKEVDMLLDKYEIPYVVLKNKREMLLKELQDYCELFNTDFAKLLSKNSIKVIPRGQINGRNEVKNTSVIL